MLTGGLKEAVRTVHVSYPVPFLATVFGLFGLALAELGRDVDAGKGWLMLGAACLMFLVAIAIVIKAVFVSPALLRSERYLFLERMMEVSGDEKTDPSTRERLQTKLIESWDDSRIAKSTDRFGFLSRDDKKGARR